MIDDSEKVHYKLKYTLTELTTDPSHHDILFLVFVFNLLRIKHQ